ALGRSLASDARKLPASSHTFCQWASALRGLKRDAIANAYSGCLARDRGAAQVARSGEDDLLDPLDGRRGQRSVDPLAVLQRLPRPGDPKRVGAQVAVEDHGGQLDPLGGV